METIYFLLLAAACLISSRADAAECENGWTRYKDETCIKAFTDFLTYDEANVFCASQGNSVSTATLVMVKEPDLQEFLADYTKDIYENLWLGGKYDNSSGEFKWEDGSPLTFTNWAEGYPRNSTTSEACIQLRPLNAKFMKNFEGKWEDTICQRRNLAMCQRILAWSLEDATREILNLRKELQSTKDDFQDKIDAVNSRVVPVGSIYIEYFNQPSPQTLWPTLTWQDITNSYAGLFFRALGGNSDIWGNTQVDCAPRISQVHYWQLEGDKNPITLPKSGWSEYGATGNSPSTGPVRENLRFFVEDCEVRPQNQAIKLWKRIS